MEHQILIDMIRLRSVLSENPDLALPEAFFFPSGIWNGMKSIRELATFRFTCRRCETAPCISVCPADALEKNPEGLVERHTNLCVSCKSCVTICPFGTIMTDFFSYHRNKDLYYDLNDAQDVQNFINASPPGTVILTDQEESPGDHIYRLNKKVLIKDYLFTTDNP